jgi:VWFA-related protein
MRKLILTIAALAAFPLFAQQQPPFTEEVDVNVVLVDATVTDRTGNQILGLTKDDFVVKEDGVVQEVASLDYFTNRRLLDSPEQKAKFQVERVREERYFILFFHKLLGDSSAGLNTMSELMRAKQSSIEWVDKEMLPEDRVAVAGFDARLKIYADFTSDKNVLRRALNDVVTNARGLTSLPRYAGPASIMREMNTKKMINDTGRMYDSLELLADSLPNLAARKVLVLFSPGFGDRLAGSSNFLENEQAWYQPMIRALNKRNVTVYSVNLLRNADSYPEEQPLQRMAYDTGGDYYRNIVSFATPLDRIEEENNGYYLLSYYSTRKKGTHGYQKLDVALRNPEFRVKAREGYAY